MNDQKLLDAYEMGIDDGLLNGTQCAIAERRIPNTDALRAAYKRGYDHGVALYCEINHEEEANENI